MIWQPTRFTRSQLEERRLEAAQRFQQQDHIQSQIARDLGVCKSTVSLWKKTWKAQGTPGLKATSSTGRPARMFDVERFEQDLARGARHFGYPTESWSTKRVAEMLYLTQDVKFHSQHMRRILHQLGYSHQKSSVQSRERNEQIIGNWVKTTLPEIKKKVEEEKATLVVVDEVGSSLKTLKGHTWAKCGKTPVLPTHGHWESLSIIGGMTPCGKVYQQTYPHAIRAVQVVKFFKHLLQHLEGALVVLLDNARIHRAKVVQVFLRSEAGKRITVFHTPPYAPEFNPIEWLWSWMKRTRIQNLCPKNLAELKQAWRLGFRQVRSKPHLARSFFQASQLGNF